MMEAVKEQKEFLQKEFQYFTVTTMPATATTKAKEQTTLLLQRRPSARWPHPYEVTGALVDVESKLGLLGGGRNSHLRPDNRGDFILEFCGKAGLRVVCAFLAVMEQRMVEKNGYSESWVGELKNYTVTVKESTAMKKTDRRCENCDHCKPAIMDGKESSLRFSCDVPFDLSTAPVVVSRHYIIPPGVTAPECPHWTVKPGITVIEKYACTKCSDKAPCFLQIQASDESLPDHLKGRQRLTRNVCPCGEQPAADWQRCSE